MSLFDFVKPILADGGLGFTVIGVLSIILVAIVGVILSSVSALIVYLFTVSSSVLIMLNHFRQVFRFTENK